MFGLRVSQQFLLSQRFFEPLAGAVVDDARRTRADAQLFGDLLIRHAAHAQRHNAAGARIARGQQRAHTVEQGAAGGGLGQGVLDIKAEKIVKRDGGAALAQRAQPEVARDTEQPGLFPASPR